jgi:hypothetical protein
VFPNKEQRSPGSPLPYQSQLKLEPLESNQFSGELVHTPDGEEVGSVEGLEEGSLLGVALGLCATVAVGEGGSSV